MREHVKCEYCDQNNYADALECRRCGAPLPEHPSIVDRLSPFDETFGDVFNIVERDIETPAMVGAGGSVAVWNVDSFVLVDPDEIYVGGSFCSGAIVAPDRVCLQ